MSTPIIRIQNLSKSYGGVEALKGLDLEVMPGECVGLLGSNGAGKSTTIRILIGQLKPSAGLVEVLGVNPSLEPKKVHSAIGYIPDNLCLYDELTVEQNVLIFAQLYGASPEACESILSKIQLTEKRKSKVKDLSKGLKQRVLIARALVHNPQIVILDEPTTGLDPKSAESIYLLLEDLKKNGTTILLTTHLMNDVDRLCDRIVFINRGEKVEEGAPLELKRKYSTPTVQIDYSVDGLIHRVSCPHDQSLPGRIAQLQVDSTILSIHTHEMKLEDIFIALVSEDEI